MGEYDAQFEDVDGNLCGLEWADETDVGVNASFSHVDSGAVVVFALSVPTDIAPYAVA